MSLRRLGLKDDPDAELVFDIRCIRKKLNWKQVHTGYTRPAKRQKLSQISCYAHLTVWDNSVGIVAPEPLRVWTRKCDISLHDDDRDPRTGRRVVIDLESPFIIPKRDLRVQKRVDGERRFVMAEQYFIEVKILPTRDDLKTWPPIPLLGKSEGDTQTKIDQRVVDSLEGALVARYHSLTPESQTPLSVFYYFEGKSFRSKYGLEVLSEWQSRQDHACQKGTPLKQEDVKAEEWMKDEDGLLFGKTHHEPDAVRHTRRSVLGSIGKLRNAGAQATIALPSSTKFKFEPNLSEARSKKYREFTMDDYACPWCNGECFKTSELLLQHLRNEHCKYDYTMDEMQHSTQGRALHRDKITIMVTDPKVRAKTPMQLQTQRSVSEDEPHHATSHPLSKLRRQHRGHLPLLHVPPVRLNAFSRGKYPIIRVSGKGGIMTPAFASIAVRPTAADDPEEHDRSESEDETDDTWLTGQYLDSLDDFAQKQGWSDAKRRLAKKWGHHLIQRECYPHSRYISDALLRFVRIEKQWILRKSDEWIDAEDRAILEAESIDALEDLMQELKSMRIINENVCNDVLILLNDEDSTAVLPPEEMQLLEREANEAAQVSKALQTHDKTLRNSGKRGDLELPLRPAANLPSTICAICRTDIRDDDVWAVRCSNLDCVRPGVYHHAQCVQMKVVREAQQQPSSVSSLDETFAAYISRHYDERSMWLCALCREEQ